LTTGTSAGIGAATAKAGCYLALNHRSDTQGTELMTASTGNFLFLFSDATSYITGCTLDVSGGR